MNNNNQKKNISVSKMLKKVNLAKSIIIAEYSGLDTLSLTYLRRLAYKSQIHLFVIKNTLAKIAIKNTKFNIISSHLVGQLIYCVSFDLTSGAKLLVEFCKNNNNLVIKFGSLCNKLISLKEIKNISLIPSRKKLLSKFLITINLLIIKFIRTLNEIPKKIVNILLIIKKKLKNDFN